MKYGYFDDQNKEYVITTPKTPLPWINYLGCEEFFTMISNTGGGYSFYKDAKLLRLTRFRYNNTPKDSNGHYFYIKDGDTIWNPGWQPTQTPLDDYKTRHGIGYSVLYGEKNKIAAEVTAFVPIGDNCEILKVSVTNKDASPRSVSLFSYVEFCLWNAMDDMTNFQRNYSTGEVEIDGSTIYHKTEYRERRKHYAIFSVNAPVDAYDTNRDSFLGVYGSPAAPEAIQAGKLTNSHASGWSPIGAHELDLDLAAGETKTFVFVLGYIENEKEDKWEAPGIVNKTRAKEMLARYATAEKADEALAALKAYWTNLLSTYSAVTPEDKFTRMVNTCISTSAWSRSTCPAPLPIMNPASDAAWASVIPARTSSALSTWSRTRPARDFSTSRQHSSRTAPHIISISRSQSAVIWMSEADSMMTRSGSSQAYPPISARQEIIRSSTRSHRSTTTMLSQHRSWSI